MFTGVSVRAAKHRTQRGGEECPQFLRGTAQGWSERDQSAIWQQQGCQPERHQLWQHATHVNPFYVSVR